VLSSAARDRHAGIVDAGHDEVEDAGAGLAAGVGDDLVAFAQQLLCGIEIAAPEEIVGGGAVVPEGEAIGIGQNAELARGKGHGRFSLG
jgi:hypothetical protein